MAQRNNIYADGRVVVENTPSQFIFGAAASEEEVQRNKDLDAVYDFIYADEYDSGDSDMAEVVDENEVISDAPGDSVWSTQASGNVSGDLGGAGSVDSLSASAQQVDPSCGKTEVENGGEDHNSDTASSCRPIGAVGGTVMAHITYE